MRRRCEGDMAAGLSHGVYLIGQGIDGIGRSRSRSDELELFARSLLGGVRGDESLFALLLLRRRRSYGGLSLTAGLDMGIASQQRVHGRDEQEGQESGEDEASDHGDAEGTPGLGARAESDRDREDPEHR